MPNTQMAGPFEGYKAIGRDAYQHVVPESTRWYNVVLMTLRKPLSRRDKPQDMDEDKENIWEVVEIVNARKVTGVVPYQVC